MEWAFLGALVLLAAAQGGTSWLWYRLLKQTRLDMRAELMVTDIQHDREVREYVALLATARAVADAATHEAAHERGRASDYEHQMREAVEAMLAMEARFSLVPSDLPTPAIGRHKHRWDSMRDDGLGWRCGICGDPKGDQPALTGHT